MTFRRPLLVALALATAGCAHVGAPGTKGRPAGGVAAMANAVDPERMDLATFERLSAAALAEALAGGDAATVQRFVAFADGEDPQPASSRAIARTALEGARAASAVSAALQADVARIAAGGATPVKAAAETGIVFPKDEGDHPRALTEWWYVNGNLETRGVVGGFGKQRFGYEFTLFKAGALLHWAHVALTDQKGKRFSYARQFVPNREAKASTTGLDVAYGPHKLAAVAGGSYVLSTRFGNDALDLRFTPKKAPLLINGNGKIDMPEGKDSWYYSQTRMEVQGEVVANGERKAVTGLSWIDHQWGPFFVTGFFDRWDWFSLQFEDGTEYNLFGFRDKDGNAGARHVNRSGADGRGTVGTTFTMDRLAWWKSPATGLNYTTKWRIGLPETQETVELEALLADQELARKVPFLRDPLPNYWEGAMKATKRRADGKQVAGVAYCEHFGFATPNGPRK